MYRYVAFRWNSKDPSKTAVAQQLASLLLSGSLDYQSVLNVPGFCVLHAQQPGGVCHAYSLKRGSGVIVGKLFSRRVGGAQIPLDPKFDDKESELIVRSQGRHLIEHYWGNYVAFLGAPGADRQHILRDPTGALPCFLTRAAGIDIFVSDMEDYVRLRLPPLSIDWEHIAAFFMHSRLITRTTGFSGVSQLYAGECAAVENDTVTSRMSFSFYWDPVDVYEADTIDDPARARAALRCSILQCVNAWASCYESIVHELSGGLDSSIVAACITKANRRPDVLGFHYFTEMSEGDERNYARAAARSAKCELVESKATVTETTLENLLSPLRIATPSLLGFLPASELFKQHLMSERHAGAVFSGRGGDHLFQQNRDRLMAAEYAHRYGIRPPLLGIVADTSRLTNQSIWSICAATIVHGLLRRSIDPYENCHRAPSILSDTAYASICPQTYSHPWVENARKLPACKTRQIFDLVDCQLFYLRPCPYAEQIHPLISQPIIETCLQIPSYVLAHGGRDRGLVREAFRLDVPNNIINRHSKGGTTGYFNRLLVENLSFLRALLLDGMLVREGILNRVELERQLSEQKLVRGDERTSILNAARAETWLNTWAALNQEAAA